MKSFAVLLFLMMALTALFAASGPSSSNGNDIHPAGKSQPFAGSGSTQRDSCCLVTGQNAGIGSGSLYQLESKWTDQDGRQMRLSEFCGKTRVIAMFYSHCTSACPTTINDMKRIESALPQDIRQSVGFVLVSFDPDRDTPQTLRRLAEGEGLNLKHWTLLTGPAYDDRTLAAMLGVEFKKKADGDFMHSSQITVLNANGDIVYKHSGVNQPIADVVQAVESTAGRP